MQTNTLLPIFHITVMASMINFKMAAIMDVTSFTFVKTLLLILNKHLLNIYKNQVFEMAAILDSK